MAFYNIACYKPKQLIGFVDFVISFSFIFKIFFAICNCGKLFLVLCCISLFGRKDITQCNWFIDILWCWFILKQNSLYVCMKHLCVRIVRLQICYSCDKFFYTFLNHLTSCVHVRTKCIISSVALASPAQCLILWQHWHFLLLSFILHLWYVPVPTVPLVSASLSQRANVEADILALDLLSFTFCFPWRTFLFLFSIFFFFNSFFLS